MALHHSPRIITDNLVFYHDANNTQKSWKGIPTTNLVDPSWASWSIDGSGQGSIGTRTITSTYECTITDSNANTRQSIYITSGISASTTYTFSVQYKKIWGTPSLRFQIQAYNGGSYISTMSFATTAELGITDVYGWQTAKITLTTPASTTRILWFMQDGNDYTTYSHAFSLANVQCEQQSYATPFVAGTRSNTQSIINLVNSASAITANSLTYASDNTYSFDGSTNYITAGALPGSFAQFTVSLWFYSTSVSNYKNPIDCNFSFEQYSGVTTPVWMLSGSTTNNSLYTAFSAASGQISANTWYNSVMVRDVSGAISTYMNGVQIVNQQSAPYGFVGVFNNVVIGKGFHLDSAANRSFAGKIPVVQIYNRGLSATEVEQNFNALRGRYGI